MNERERLLLPIADDELVLGWRNSEWTGIAPFLEGYVPQIRELGLTIPDRALRKDEETGTWLYTEPDWEKLRAVVTGHGPASAERLAFRRLSREDVAWVEQAVLAEAA